MKQVQLFDDPPPAIPDLASYDWILLNTSAGKDSQVLLDEVYNLADAAGVRDRLVAVHADLGRMEWAGTKALAAQQAAHYNLPFEVVRRRGGDLLSYVEHRGMWPSNAARYCTSDFKRTPVRTLMTRLADQFHGGPHSGPSRASGGRACRILNCLGLRAEESPIRAKRPLFSRDHANSRREVDEWLPIHHWGLEDVWIRIKETGVPYHRAYDLGMPRLSCVFCIFAPAPALITAGHLNRELLREYVAVERRIGHSFKKDLQIIQIEQAVDRGEHPVMANVGWERCA